ncbi:protein translocase subunit SecF [Ectothiorhodospiraceae bacterium WFHF3C12]|nr:protein translocase subunit SecF [Ectothiorhodospiraceae bacterium WFHF3C12]
MDLFKRETHINFMALRRVTFVVSLALLAISIAAIAARGLNLGIDFTGGTLVEVKYPEQVELSQVRRTLAGGGYPDAIVQYFGTSRDVLIRLGPQLDGGQVDNEKVGDRIMSLLRQEHPEAQRQRVEFVGPEIGSELRDQGGLALLFALGGILIYVAFRFEYRFALGAVAALIHDVTITVGFFAVTQVDFDLTVLAALLAVIGYSLNDTIVVFDRIRENFVKIRRDDPVETTDISINQTLSRTLMTSATTMLVVLALFFLGGETVGPFALALVVGIVVGTYSSIYVASALALALGVSKADMMPPEKEGEDAEELP